MQCVLGLHTCLVLPEAFDKVERDLEDTKALALDGSSAHLLDHLLTPFAAILGIA